MCPTVLIFKILTLRHFSGVGKSSLGSLRSSRLRGVLRSTIVLFAGLALTGVRSRIDIPFCLFCSTSGLHVAGTWRRPRCCITISSGEGDGLTYDDGKFNVTFHSPPVLGFGTATWIHDDKLKV